MSRWTKTLLMTACLTFVGGTAWGAEADRAREMLRRTQEALRQSQADNSELTQQKSQAQEKLKTVSDQLESQRNASKQTQASLRRQLQTATTAQADLTRRLEEAQRQLTALTSKDQQAQSDLKQRDAQLKQTQADLATSKASNSSCEAKNLELYKYGQELAQRYQHKGVWAALKQEEPLAGLNNVEIQNILQEYREKLDAQKVRTGTTP